MSNIHTKLQAVQSSLKAPKGQYNSFGKYKYRSCEDILEAVKPLLNENGLTIVLTDEVVPIYIKEETEDSDGAISNNRVYIKSTATLSDGESEITSTAYARESLSKRGMDSSQVTGTASSYARKYALNGLLLIDDSKDDDTREPTDEAPKPRKRSTRKAKQDAPTEARSSKLLNAVNARIEEASKLGINSDSFYEYAQAYFGTSKLEELDDGKLTMLGQHIRQCIEDKKSLANNTEVL